MEMLSGTRRVSVIVLLVSCIATTAIAQDNKQAPPARPDLPWDKRSYEDRLYNGRYEDRYTFKHGKPYTLDPWTWGYTKEFAERFHMPEQCIEPDLKGALAVAFRMTPIGVNTECGMGGQAENCWQQLNCQMDIYYDNRIELPWNYPEIMRDNLMLGLHSGQYLHDPSFRSRGVGRHFYGRRDDKDQDKEKPMGAMNSGGGLRHGKFNQGGSVLALFDREYQPGIGLISWIGNGVCPEYTGSDKVFMRFVNYDDFQKFRRGLIKESDIRTDHRIDFPATFLKRAKAVYDEQNKANDEVMDRLLKGFFKSRNAVPSAPAGTH